MNIKKPLLAAGFALAIALTPAPSQTLYWGGTTGNLTNGTVLPNTPAGGLNGTWSDSLLNWSSTNNGTASYNGTIYQAWPGSGAFANFGYSTDNSTNPIVTVTGNKTLTGLFASLTSANAGSRRFNLNGATINTNLTLSGTNAVFLIASADPTRGVAIGDNNSATNQLSLGASSTRLVKDGGGNLIFGNFSTFVSNDAFTGDVLIRSGSIVINPATSMNGTTRFDLVGYRPSVVLTNSNGNQGFTAPLLTLNLATSPGISDRISDNATITLANRGGIDFRSGNATGTETIGSLVASTTGFIFNSQGTAGQIVNLGNLTRGPDGRGTLIMTVDSSDVLRHNIRITNPTGLTTDALLPWFSTSRGEWLYINSSNNNQLTRVASTNATLDASLWASTYNATSNVRINGVMTNAVSSNLTLNSLAFLGTGTASTLELGNNVLTLNAGALGLSPNGNVNYTIANGTITSGTNELFINTGNSNTSSLVLNSVLAGTMNITVSGITTVTFGNATATAGTPNTYSGTVYVNSGTLNLNKDAAITGNVMVGGGGGLVLNRSAGLASTSNVTLARDALFSVGGITATLNGTVTSNGGQILLGNTPGLTLSNNGTGLAFNGGLLTHSSTANGTLNLLTNVSYAASAEQQAVFQRVNTGNLLINLNTGANVGNAERTFAIANSTVLEVGKAEMLIDALLANGGSGNTTASLRKTGDGVLQLTANNTFTGGVTIDEGTLHLSRIQAAARSNLVGTFSNSGIESEILTFVAPITGTMAVGQAVTGTNIATGRLIAGILNEYQVILNGTVGTIGNTFATDIALGAVDRIGQLASPVTVNNSGTLLMDSGTLVNNIVTVNSGGVLAGTGTITGATAITGSLRPGHSIGTLIVNNNVTWNSGDAWVFELGTAASSLVLANSGDSTQDLLNITSGSFLKGTGSSFTFDFAGTGSPGWYKLVDWTATTDFVAGDFSYTNLASGFTASFTVDSGTSALYLNVIPEPSTWALLGFGLSAWVFLRRRNRTRSH